MRDLFEPSSIQTRNTITSKHHHETSHTILQGKKEQFLTEHTLNAQMHLCEDNESKKWPETKENLPFADNVPPVTHPATTVFVMSCFARTFKTTYKKLISKEY